MTTRLALTLLIAAIATFQVSARKVKGARGKVNPPAEVASPHVSVYDTIRGISTNDYVTFAGYDKTVRATKESVFATNRTSRPIVAVMFTIAYYDMSGRMLHKATHRTDIEIPANETRRIDIATWDRQQSFVFHRSKRPTRSAATPYDVKISCDTIITID